jgi:AraC-like DNA-binding protein
MPPTTHPATWDVKSLLEQCDCRRQRRSGPGGQHRNKVETAVVLTHHPTGVQGEASERRSQEQNRRQAIFRLRVNLALSVRALSPGQPIQPSPLWQKYCHGRQIAIGATHSDYPAMLAEALDVLAALDLRIPDTAASLGCSATQLTRFLKTEPRALRDINQHRAARGLKPLR